MKDKTEIVRRIETGEVKSIFPEVYPSNFAQFFFMSVEHPDDEDISNIDADDYQITDYELVMKWVDQITS